MRLKVSLLIVLILLPLTALFAQGSAETLTITTYYPSPYGVYNTLRLYPNNNNTPGAACTYQGEMFYSSTTNNVYVCKGATNPTWQELGAGYWGPIGTNGIRNLNTGNVGINTGGTTAPTKTLTVNGSVWAQGQLIIPITSTAPTDNGSIWIQQ